MKRINKMSSTFDRLKVKLIFLLLRIAQSFIAEWNFSATFCRDKPFSKPNRKNRSKILSCAKTCAT
jgi:hypothetical protein